MHSNRARLSSSRRALLVGGGGALGCHIAAHLLAHKIDVIIHGGRNKHNFRATVAHLRTINPHVGSVWRPIINHRQCYHTLRRLLPVDILIFLYGPYLAMPISTTKYRDWQCMAISNFVFPAGLLAANFEYLQQTEYGRVNGFSSDYRTEMEGYKEIAAYAAAKWAFASAIRSAAAQNNNARARYYLIAPGYIDYPPSSHSQQGKEYHHSVEEVASGVITLLDRDLDIENGSIIRLDTIIENK